MADNRLDPDISLLGYWGFDEALETNDALDGATNYAPANLTVTASPSVQAGRVGSARDFNGTSSFASVTNARFRLLGDLTLICWCKLDTINSGGSLLRTIVSCGGPVSADPLLYGLSVDTANRLVYKHTSASGLVIVRSTSVIKTGQYYCVMVRRFANGPNQDLQFIVDNVEVPVLDVSVNAVASALPVPPPIANASAIFSAARSQKESDSAFWDGLLDELSVHEVARPYQPYLRGSYYRVALRNPTSRLTAPNTVLAVSSADMGAGVRWWCYERDKDIYVVRESPLGSFGPDTRLTTTGAGSATLAKAPELIYDFTTDTLLVFFVAGNRIFKLSALSTDDPVGTNMPFTADSYPAIKSLDNTDGGPLGMGGGQRQVNPLEITYINRSPVKIFGEDTPSYNIGMGGGLGLVAQPSLGITTPSLNFMERPSPDGFGLAMGPLGSNQTGYRVYRLLGGGSLFLGVATYVTVGGFFFFSLAATPPVVGDAYYVEAVRPDGRPSGVVSNTVVYRRFEPQLVGLTYFVGREGDGTDTANVGMGAGQLVNYAPTYVNRQPVKFSGEDGTPYDLGQGGGHHGRVTASGVGRPGAAAIEKETK